ncbi:probable E3 ubiquitin-protein ligase BAH1-like 1 [Asparagus officinalis]|uniref:probable E3 ubiquitin-protein ligase BAH1-like 1 n=1 Tax=Asparagus officinalis TaxID=4686 RepID=UPI00098DFEC6|nr:probable E3 ubiquitin-protein ligase BAH1-like 1 [Asparagus officinalis]
MGSLLVHLFPKRLLSASTENTLAFLVYDEKFFSELAREASEVAGCFSSRGRHSLLHLHVAPGGIQRYMWRLRHCFTDDQQVMVQEGRLLLDYVTMNAIAIRKILKKYDKVHGSVTGRNFKTEMHDKRIELLQSPWLIELGAFYVNFTRSNIGEPGEFFRKFSCDLSGAQPVMSMTFSDSIKYEYSLTCAVCLDTVFNPYALSCGHLFCKNCACSSASMLIFQGLKTASKKVKCPVCRSKMSDCKFFPITFETFSISSLQGEVPNLKPASIQLCPHIAKDWFYGEDKEHNIKVVVP